MRLCSNLSGAKTLAVTELIYYVHSEVNPIIEQ